MDCDMPIELEMLSKTQKQRVLMLPSQMLDCSPMSFIATKREVGDI